MTSRRVLCVIAARGGSKGVPGKHLRALLGKPLIVWAVEHALAAPEIDRVVVSTDSTAIAEAARRAGAEVPFRRPAELATSSAGKFQVWQHALATCQSLVSEPYDLYIDVDCTNPLIEPHDVSSAIARFDGLRARGVPVDAVFTVAEARRNPYFNLVEPDASGALRMSKRTEPAILARQDAPAVYEHVAGVYVLDAAYLRRAHHLLDGHAEGYLLPPEKAFDIDTELDFVLVEHLMKRRLGVNTETIGRHSS